MTTVGDLAQRTRHQLMGMHRSELNTLAAGITSTAGTLTLGYEETPASRGSYLAIDRELVYVFHFERATRTATVARGMLGTTAASHSTGALVEVDARFPYPMIVEALRDEVRSWPIGLFRTESVEVEVAAGGSFIDTSDFDDFDWVLQVKREHPDGRWVDAAVRIVRDLEAYPAGALVLDRPILTSTQYQVTVSRRFSTTVWEDTTSLENVVGMPEDLLDIPPLGAAWRLLLPRESLRTYTEAQGEPRNAAEVPPTSITQAAVSLRTHRDFRIKDEVDKLRNRYPFRFR